MNPDFSDVVSGPSGRLLAVTQEQLNRIIGFGPPAPEGSADEINEVVADAGILTHLQLAHFLGQFIYECAYLQNYVETVVPGQYEFRVSLGNTRPGDGSLFRGRGAPQLTGRSNYASFWNWLQVPGRLDAGVQPVDVLSNPDAVSTRPYRWLAAAYYWNTHPGLATAADHDDVAGCTRIVTGASIPGDAQGLKSRERLTNHAIQELG